MSRLLPQTGPSSLPYPPYQPSTEPLSTSYTTSLTSLRPLALQVIPAAVAGSDAWVVWSRRLLGVKDALYPPADPPSFFLSLPPASNNTDPSLSATVRLINTALLLAHLAPSSSTNILSAQSPSAVLFLAQVKDLYLILSNLRPRSALLWLAQDLLIELCTVLCSLLKALQPERTGEETYALVFAPTLFKHPELVCGALVPRDVGVLEKMWVKEAAKRVKLLGKDPPTPDLPTSLSTLRSKLLQDLTKNLVALLLLADLPLTPTTTLPIPPTPSGSPIPPPPPAVRPRQFAADVLVPPRSSSSTTAGHRAGPGVPKGFVFNAPQADAVRLEETQMSFMEDGEDEGDEGERAEKGVGSDDPDETTGMTGGGKGKGVREGRGISESRSAAQKSVRQAEQDADSLEPSASARASASAEDELEEVEDALQVRGVTSPPPPISLPTSKAEGKRKARADLFEEDAGPVAPSRPVKLLPHTSSNKHRAESSRAPLRAIPPHTPPNASARTPNGKKRARSEAEFESESEYGSPRKRRATSVVPNTDERVRELKEDLRRRKDVDWQQAIGVLLEATVARSPGASTTAYRSPRREGSGGRLKRLGSAWLARAQNGVGMRRAAEEEEEEEEEEESASPEPPRNHPTSPSNGRFKRAREQAGSSSRAANGVGPRAPLPGPSRAANGVGTRRAAEEEEGEARSMEVGSSRRRDRDWEEREAGSEEEYEDELEDEYEDELTDDAPYRPSHLAKRSRTHPSASASASPQTQIRYRTGHNLTSRNPWTPREDAVFQDALHEMYLAWLEDGVPRVRKWQDIVEMHGPNGTKSKGLKDRTNVQLKDRAVNLRNVYTRMGRDVPAYLVSKWEAPGVGDS